MIETNWSAIPLFATTRCRSSALRTIASGRSPTSIWSPAGVSTQWFGSRTLPSGRGPGRSTGAGAEDYGISYPTVRLRLDRLIQKIRLLDDYRLTGPFERRLRALYAERRIDLETLKLLLHEHQRELEGPIDTGDRS